MSNKTSQKNWDKHLVLDAIKRGLLAMHSQKEEKTQDITYRQSLEYKKQEAEINKTTQHTKLRTVFTWFILGYLCVYTLIVLGLILWWFLYLNPQAPGVHYVLVALIGSLTVGLFQCISAVARGVFGKDKK